MGWNELHAALATHLGNIEADASDHGLKVIPTLVLRDPANVEGCVVITSETEMGLQAVASVIETYRTKKPTTEGTVLDGILGRAHRSG